MDKLELIHLAIQMLQSKESYAETERMESVQLDSTTFDDGSVLLNIGISYPAPVKDEEASERK